MSAFYHIDRDKTLAYAMGRATEANSISCVYQSISDRLWHCVPYNDVPEGDAINPSVRYVLPFGIVTKLS